MIYDVQVFFSSRDMESVLSRFRILHITLPGQGPGAVTLSTDLGPPSLDSLARLTASVLGHYNVTSCVGLGAGLGANVLLRLGIQNNKILDGIILLNATAQGKGWTEWLYHKRINQVRFDKDQNCLVTNCLIEGIGQRN